MFLLVRKRMLRLLPVLLLVLLGASLAAGRARSAAVATGDFNYRVFVAGVGTVEGKWCGSTGIAVIGLETRPGPTEEQELKLIDLLVANNSSAELLFNPDLTLVNRRGGRYGLKAKGQPEVLVKPGAMSQGTVIISVPKGFPDREWVLEIRGGNLKEGVVLPLRVAKVIGR